MGKGNKVAHPRYATKSTYAKNEYIRCAVSIETEITINTRLA